MACTEQPKNIFSTPSFLLAFQRLAQRERASCTEANIEHSIGTPRPKLCRTPPPIRPDSQPSPLDFASVVSWNFTIPRRRFGSAGPYAEGESWKSEVCLHCRARQSTLLCLLLQFSNQDTFPKPKSTTILELFSHLRVSRSASVSVVCPVKLQDSDRERSTFVTLQLGVVPSKIAQVPRFAHMAVHTVHGGNHGFRTMAYFVRDIRRSGCSFLATNSKLLVDLTIVAPSSWIMFMPRRSN